MHSEHELTDRVMRAYLLGTLPSGEAVKLEERYFVNATLLRGVQAAESALIADYLAGRLEAAEQPLFEERYARNPAMAAKLAAARDGKAAAELRPVRSAPWEEPQVRPGAAAPGSWRLVFAAAAVLAIGLGAVWTWLDRREPPSQAVAVQAPQPAAAQLFAELRLAPGVSKGASASAAATRDLHAPLPAGGARLMLELPGVRAGTAVDCRLYRFDAEGRRLAVWSVSEPVLSEKASIGVMVPAEALSTVGDYLAEVSAASGGAVLETYLFRVIDVPK